MKILNYLAVAILIILLSLPVYSESPYKIQWEKEQCILGTGITLSSMGYLLYRSVPPPTRAEVENLNKSSVNNFDRSAIDHYSTSIDKSSDIFIGAFIAAPFLLFSDKAVRGDWTEISIMYLEVGTFIIGASTLSKGAITRYRPYAYNPKVELDNKLISDSKMSFFSNHTMTAFASAVFISTIYSDYYPRSGWKPYIWAGSLLSAGIVGYMRYESGMHFPTDIMAGAVLGSFIGYAIPWLHRNGNENLSISPDIFGDYYGLSFHVRF